MFVKYVKGFRGTPFGVPSQISKVGHMKGNHCELKFIAHTLFKAHSVQKVRTLWGNLHSPCNTKLSGGKGTK